MQVAAQQGPQRRAARRSSGTVGLGLELGEVVGHLPGHRLARPPRPSTSPTPLSSVSVPAAARSSTSAGEQVGDDAAAVRNAWTRYVGSCARSSRNAIRRRAASPASRPSTRPGYGTAPCLIVGRRRFVGPGQRRADGGPRLRSVPTGPQATVRRLERAISRLAGDAIARMDEALPWYRAMPRRRAGPGSTWSPRPASPRSSSGSATPAPEPAITRRRVRHRPARAGPAVTPAADRRAGPGHHRGRRGARRRAGRARRGGSCCARRCCATRARSRSPRPRSTPQAAEARGAWDARLEALVVDALLRGEADEPVRSRAAALGWGSASRVAVVVGRRPTPQPGRGRRRHPAGRPGRHLDALTGVQGDRLVVVLGGARATRVRSRPPLRRAVRRPARSSSARPWPTCSRAASSAAAAVAGLRAAAGLAGRAAAGPADDLLPERALDGDPAGPAPAGRRGLPPAASAPAALLETAGRVPRAAASLEGAARALFVHPNTVRYRLRRVAEVTGLAPDRPARRVHAAARARPRPARRRPVRRRLCRNPTSHGPDTSSDVDTASTRPCVRNGGTVLVIVAPGQGAQAPGFLTPWLELPQLRGPAALAVGLRRPRPGRTTAPRPTPTRSATPPSPSRCWWPPGWSPLLELFPHPADAFGAGRRRRRPLGRRDHRGSGRARHHRRAGDGPGPRARPGDGRGRRRARRPA